jgi:fructose-specific phosphotransferase system IIA component
MLIREVKLGAGRMMLTQILQPNCVKVPVESTDKKAVIIELVDLVDGQTTGLILDKKTVLDAVLQREEARSTGIGSGVAIPHGKSMAIKELVMALGIAEKPIEFGSADGQPVRIIILLLSPSDQTGPHIQALAKISRLMLDNGFKEKLERATSAEEVYELISKGEAH